MPFQSMLKTIILGRVCVCVCVCARTHLYGVDGQLYFLPGLPGPKGIMRTMPSAYVCVCVCVCVSMV